MASVRLYKIARPLRLLPLKPEMAKQYDAGATYKKDWKGEFLKNITGDVDVYYNEISDKIIAMPTSNQFRWTMVNLGYVEIKGKYMRSLLLLPNDNQ